MDLPLERRFVLDAIVAGDLGHEIARRGEFSGPGVDDVPLAAQHATRTEVQLMSKIAANEARERSRPERLVTINGELHQTIYRAAHNRYLLQSITTIVDALGLLRHSTFILPGSIELAHREHMKIIKAIRERNQIAAEQLAREHVRHALAMRLQLLKNEMKARV